MPTGDEQQTIDMGASMETEQALEIIDLLNEVSDVLAMAGPEVTFVGSRKASAGPIGRLQGPDVFHCPRGWFVLMREPSGPHWAVAGDNLSAALDGIHESPIRDTLRSALQQQGLA